MDVSKNLELPRSRLRWRRALMGIAIPAGALMAVWWLCVRMPGESYRGPLQPTSDEERQVELELRRHIRVLAEDIGERHDGRPFALERTVDYLDSEFRTLSFEVRRHEFVHREQTFVNLEASVPGASEEFIVVGAHYDSARSTPAANDNASGTAAVLSLAGYFATRPQRYGIRFVAFANEEPPHFQREGMGSLRYAHDLRDRGESPLAMVSIETIGYYRDEAGSQHYPWPLNHAYPSEGNFIGFVSDVGSRDVLHRALSSFRSSTDFPSEGGALPGFVRGVGWSDHWAFWQVDCPALMVTDTAIFRYPHYHQPSDTVDKLSFDRMARVVVGLRSVVRELANP
ncbi:MAG: M28 family peptidase [Myxococcota bacterium]